MFRHPKYYKELRKRNKSDQVISETTATANGERAPGPGLKPQASSDKPQATSSRQQAKPEPVQVQASSAKRQASQPE